MTPEEFFKHVEKTESCWLWKAAHNRNGYGTRSFNVGFKNGKQKVRTVLAHRFSYELHKGPIPQGLQVRHMCAVRDCVNPAHLEVGTALQNWHDIPPEKRSQVKYERWKKIPIEIRRAIARARWKRMTPESLLTRSQKIAASKLGLKLSPEHRAKIAAAHTGMKQGDEQRQRHSEKMKELWASKNFNPVFSAEGRAANSAKHKELWASGHYANKKPRPKKPKVLKPPVDWSEVRRRSWANMSPEAKAARNAKLSATKSGIKFSPEHREKLRLAKLGKKRKVDTLDL